MRLPTLRFSGLPIFVLLIYARSFGRCESVGDLDAVQADAGVDSNNDKAVDIQSGVKDRNQEGGTLFVSDSISISEDEEPTEPPELEDLYFYLFDNESSVTEYEAPSNKQEKDEPDFLYNPLPGHIQIVEFYAQWCPHCAQFRPKYNAFAKKMKEIAKQNNIQLDIYAISCVPHKKLCQDQDIDGYPIIKLYVGDDAEGKEGIEIDHTELHPFSLLQIIADKTGNAISPAFATSGEDEEQHDSEEKNNYKALALDNISFWLRRTKRDIYNDAYLSFHFAMQHGIFVGRDPPNEEAKLAFQNWIYLLDEVLPPTWRLKAMISDIAENIETVLESEDTLLEIVDRYPPPRKTWSQSCSRGDSTMGYTCGLWQLFHIATLGLVEWNLNNVAGSKRSYLKTGRVDHVLRDYIEHFFGCEVCRINFLHEFDSCGFNRCERLTTEIGTLEDWKELPLWLFEFHNGVNLRLKKERTERDNRTPTQQELTDVEWPARKDCPSCWYADGRFDPDKVYLFLQLTYWPDELISSVKMRNLIFGRNTVELDTSKEEGETESWIYSLAGLVVASFVLTAASWAHQKQREVDRTGKHKKVDDDCV